MSQPCQGGQAAVQARNERTSCSRRRQSEHRAMAVRPKRPEFLGHPNRAPCRSGGAISAAGVLPSWASVGLGPSRRRGRAASLPPLRPAPPGLAPGPPTRPRPGGPRAPAYREALAAALAALRPQAERVAAGRLHRATSGRRCERLPMLLLVARLLTRLVGAYLAAVPGAAARGPPRRGRSGRAVVARHRAEDLGGKLAVPAASYARPEALGFD